MKGMKLKPGLHLNNISIFNFYITENSLQILYKEKSVGALCEIKRTIFRTRQNISTKYFERIEYVI